MAAAVLIDEKEDYKQRRGNPDNIFSHLLWLLVYHNLLRRNVDENSENF
jgi:hypothetical protein